MDRCSHHSPRHVPPTAVHSDGTGGDAVQRPKPDEERNERCTSGTAGWSARAQEHQYQRWYRSTTPSGECMDGTQQLQSTNPYLREQLQLWDAVVGRGFTTSSEDMESIQQLRSATTVYLWQQVSYQTRYITSRLGRQVVQHNRIARTSLHTASHTLSWGCTQWRQQYDCKRRAQEQ